MSIYNVIVEAIDKLNDKPLEIIDYLQSLKKDVRMLRTSYRKPLPVYVNYSLQNIQSAYLITYFPHYYQLIYKILLEQDLQQIKSKKEYSLAFIGGGPGSEAYGAIKYILEHCPNIETVNINILDINAKTWSYSHSALKEFLLPNLKRFNEIKLNWNSHQFNLIDSNNINANKLLFENSDLVVIQNCINEIPRENSNALENNILKIFKYISKDSALLMIDLTTSVRSEIFKLEKAIESCFTDINKTTTSENKSASTLTSINYRPSQVIRENLLDYTDGLIPRKNLKYDFSLVGKNQTNKKEEIQRIGINSIYRPLENLNKSIKDFNDRSFIGIDFGTSCSVCAITYVEKEELKVELLQISQKDHLGISSKSTIVPSIIGVLNSNFLLGKYAQEKRRNLVLGKNAWYGFKENILDLENLVYANSVLHEHPNYPIKNGSDALVVFLKRLRIEIINIINEKKLPQEKYFSFSTPANYGLKEKEILEKYLIKSGFEKGTFRFLEEPVSSVIGTIHQEGLALNLVNDLKILVIDIGAGTVDCCAIQLTRDSDNVISETLAIHRNKNIGGNFINTLLSKKLKNKYHTINIDDEFILDNCENLKLQFCKNIRTDKKVKFILPELANDKNYYLDTFDSRANTSYKLNYFEFNEVIKDYFNGNEKFKGFKDSVEETIRKTNLSIEDFDYVIMSGGGAKNPYLRSLSAFYLGHKKLIIPDNSQEQVAMGNAIQSFISNTFGKQIIESVLNGNIYVENNTLPLFKKGDILPTLESENKIEKGVYSIWFYSDFTNERITFKWHKYKNYNILKYIVKINQESRFVFELFTENLILRIKPEIIKK